MKHLFLVLAFLKLSFFSFSNQIDFTDKIAKEIANDKDFQNVIISQLNINYLAAKNNAGDLLSKFFKHTLSKEELVQLLEKLEMKSEFQLTSFFETMKKQSLNVYSKYKEIKGNINLITKAKKIFAENNKYQIVGLKMKLLPDCYDSYLICMLLSDTIYWDCVSGGFSQECLDIWALWTTSCTLAFFICGPQ